MEFKLQAKNIRSNAAILSTLDLKSAGQIKQVIAGEFVGALGYLIACNSSTHNLAVFKETVKLLFSWDRFLVDLSNIMGAFVLKDVMNSFVRRTVLFHVIITMMKFRAENEGTSNSPKQSLGPEQMRIYEKCNF
ncbi:hypothetical protein MBANPS3_011648 [Mucor bainieri]